MVTPGNGTSVDTGAQLTAQLSLEAVARVLGRPCPGDSPCATDAQVFMLEVFFVALTFAAATWGGWVFSRFYFTDGTSQVCPIPA